MGKNFALAVLILFLIMAALVQIGLGSAIATIALPLGMVGGMAALRLLGLFVFQPLDLLTMIGFIIVLGLVVNNTILLVARTRQAEAEGMSRVDAVRSSLETRLRPIFSSTLTAIFGMLPLVLVPGPGAEIYRGLGAVIVGGCLVSHVFTLVLMPAMLRLGEQLQALRQAPVNTSEASSVTKRFSGTFFLSTFLRTAISCDFGARTTGAAGSAVRRRRDRTPGEAVAQDGDAGHSRLAEQLSTSLRKSKARSPGLPMWAQSYRRAAWWHESIRASSKLQLNSDRANYNRLAAQLKFDRAQAARMDNLFSQNAIARATKDQAESTRDADAGALAAAKAAMMKSQYQYDHGIIRAPFPGRVVQRLINPGEYATVGKDIVRLVDIGSLEVSVQIPIDSSRYLKEKLAITMVIEGKPVEGVVRAIVPVGDIVSRSIEARIVVPAGAVTVGDAAKVYIPSAEPRSVLAVPRDAIVLREDNTYIFKVDGKNTAQRIAVETEPKTVSSSKSKAPSRPANA